MIEKIRLNNFRNFSDKVISFSSQTTIIVGKNGSGKTNILEAIDLLATGKSFKAGRQEEMINYDAEIARVKGRFKQDILEVVLTRGIIKRGNVVQKAQRKKLLVNNTPKRMIDFASHFATVVFRPQDIDLITGSPSLRRRFLDDLLSKIDREYRRTLISYEKGLRRRNKVLIQIREEGVNKSSLFFWNNLLIKNGDYISKKRLEFIEFLNLQSSYEDHEFSVEYDSSAISEARLDQYANAEIASGTTLVGPHRDDLIFNLHGKDLSIYGSRGEQRMCVLWAKVAELAFIKQKLNQNPVLLLDDIFSELDHEHRKVIDDVIKDSQAILTTPDFHYVEDIEAQEVVELSND